MCVEIANSVLITFLSLRTDLQHGPGRAAGPARRMARRLGGPARPAQRHDGHQDRGRVHQLFQHLQRGEVLQEAYGRIPEVPAERGQATLDGVLWPRVVRGGSECYEILF